MLSLVQSNDRQRMHRPHRGRASAHHGRDRPGRIRPAAKVGWRGWWLLGLAWLLLPVGAAPMPPPAPPTFHLGASLWSVDDGLPQNTVDAVCQSHDGYLWVGTRYGLARFDGLRFTSYIDELLAIDDKAVDVRGVAEDAEHRLWLHSRQGLIVREKGRFRRVPLDDEPVSGPIQALGAARPGGVWVLKPKGIFRADSRQLHPGAMLPGLAEPGCIDANEADRLVDDPEGRVWIRSGCFAGWRETWFRFDPAKSVVEKLGDLMPLPTEDVGGLAVDRSGVLWLGRPGELLRWDGRNLEHVDARLAWGDRRVLNMAADPDGAVWIHSDGPTSLHRYASGQFTPFEAAPPIQRDLRDLRCVVADVEGSLWLGTGNAGLCRIISRPLMPVPGVTTSPGDEVFSVAPGRNGRVWLATESGLAVYENGEARRLPGTAQARVDGWILRARAVLEDREGTVWGATDRGIVRLRENRWESVEAPRIQADGYRLVTRLFEDRSGTLWIGTAEGLLERHRDGFRVWSTQHGLTRPTITGLLDDPAGNLWVGTDGGGLHRFRNGRFQRCAQADRLLSQQVWPLLAATNGDLWVGTPLGLNRIRSNRVSTVTRANGLFENLAYALLEDGAGNCWTFGNRGISRFRRADLEAVADGRAQHLPCLDYDETDGMPSAEGNGDQQPNASRSPDGRLWFPTTRGVVAVDPRHLRDDTFRPNVVIEEVRVDDQPVMRDDDWPDPGPNAPDHRLHLAPGRGRVVEIRYTATTFIDPEKARFRHRLEGLDSDWRDADTRRVAFYTNLRPGTYRFEVQARNHHGYWSTAPASFALVLAPRFHQRAAFPWLCLAGVALLLGTGHVLGVRAKRRTTRRRHRDEMERERARIAKDLHDDLGANLTGLALRLDVVRAAHVDPAAALRRLDDLAPALRAMVDRMREVVWTINPRCDTLESFVTYLCTYTETYLANAGLRCRLDVPSDLPTQPLAADVRHHLLMVAKETLHNTVRHAQATEVRLTLSLDGPELVLRLADNGRGFALPEATCSPLPGNGLHNLRQRVASIGGRLEIATDLGLGTRITVRLPNETHA